MFRDGSGNYANIDDEDAATSQVILNTLVEIGIDTIAGTRATFVNFPRNFISGRYPIPFEQHQLVIEVLENIEIDDSVIADLKRLSDEGYRIALDDFIFTDELASLVELADIVKVDLRAQDAVQLTEQVEKLKRFDVTLLAEKVETMEEFEICRELGFELFQGYFFSKPQVIKGKRIAHNKLAVMQILTALQNPDTDVKDLLPMICQDVSLSYKLLKYMNSAAMGLRRQIDSIQQALVLLGMNRFRKMVTLIALSSIEGKPPELMKLALVRAMMCEVLAQQLGRDDGQSFFTAGLLSTLDALMDNPLPEVLKELPLSDDLHGALLDKEGAMGAALHCTLSYEQGNWEQATCATLAPSQIRDAYFEATAWTDNVDEMAGLLSTEKKASSLDIICGKKSAASPEQDDALAVSS